MAKLPRVGAPVVDRTPDGDRPSMRRFPAFLYPDGIAKLDREVARRKAHGLNKDETGQRININRSTLLRELVDAAEYPLG
jgi:hypothetical protein